MHTQLRAAQRQQIGHGMHAYLKSYPSLLDSALLGGLTACTASQGPMHLF